MFEEDIPVIMRRRGCTLTVRIVSVDDVCLSLGTAANKDSETSTVMPGLLIPQVNFNFS